MEKDMCLGVIGGLGPMATAYFAELVIRMTKAQCDQEHLEMIIYNKPSIPDRTSYILKQSAENPLPDIISIGKKLRRQGASCIAIPCITAHYFHDEIQREIGLPVLHAIRETVGLLRDAGICRVGVMATDGTIQSGLFQREIEEAGMSAVLPSPISQKKVMDLIYNGVKAGKEPDMEQFYQVREELKASGAEVIVLGCTELSVIKGSFPLKNGFIDALEVLAKSAIEACGKEVRQEYNPLFSRL